jgi:hypothetical protein
MTGVEPARELEPLLGGHSPAARPAFHMQTDHTPGVVQRSPSLGGESVSVHVVPEGDVYLYHGKRPVPYRHAPIPEVAAPKPPSRQARPPKPVDPKAAARRRAWLFGTRGQEQLDPERALAVR